MKTVFNIARNELRQLFCSPVAWILLVIFFVQSGVAFCDTFTALLKLKGFDAGMIDNLTDFVFTGNYTGLLKNMQEYLYLYIPLLTMGMISREKSLGTDKLLMSSPVRNIEIVLGKFFSVAVYGLLLLSILLVIAAFGGIFIKDMDWGAVMTGLLGLYLLVLAYAAIGIFSSSLTRYQILAAVGSIAVLFALNYMRKVGQGIPVLRDIAYWAGISGRSDTFIEGMICSEDVIYFLTIIATFLTLTVLKLRFVSFRTSGARKAISYGTVAVCACAIAWLSSRPALMFYHDSTQMKVNTLTENSRKIMKDLDGPLTITTYVNLFAPELWDFLPTEYTKDVKRFARYTRYKPEIKMKYVYYYHPGPRDDFKSRKKFDGLGTYEIARRVAASYRVKFRMFLSPEEIDSIIDLGGEEFRIVRVLERKDGRKTVLRLFDDMQRHPGEAEISAAMKRLVAEAPRIGVLCGHGEPSLNSLSDRGYYTFSKNISFRHALVNQGFDVEEIDLSNGGIPQDINILVVADPQKPVPSQQVDAILEFVENGGRLLLAPGKKSAGYLEPIASRLGISFSNGVLVQDNKNLNQNVSVGRFTSESAALGKGFPAYAASGSGIACSDVLAIDTEGAAAAGYEAVKVAVADTAYYRRNWVETSTKDFENEVAVFEPARGDREISEACLVAALSGNNGQKVFVLGSSDMIGNGELMRNRTGIDASNYALIMEGFRWLSDGEFPVDTARGKGPDNRIRFISREHQNPVRWIFIGIIPAIVALLGIFTILRRRRR